MKKELLSEINRMKELAGIISEGSVELEPGSGYIPKGMKKNYVQGLHNETSEENMLNEDILELKQMSKQLYSFLKGKGFPVRLDTKIQLPLNPKNLKGGTVTYDKSRVTSEINVETVQIVVQEGSNELVQVLVTPSNVARVLVGGGNDWTHKAAKRFGNDWADWYKNPEILKYVNNLGNELLAQIKGKYPNMSYKFLQQNWYYILLFGYAQTAKGGKPNPNQRPNAPKSAPAQPTQQNQAAE